jgi:hypothetical protein
MNTHCEASGRLSLTSRIAQLLLRLALGVTLLSAVADRFGIWGPPGAATVSWGDWTHFVTGTVPSETLRETALALSGLKSRKLYGVDLLLRREMTVADFLGHEEHVKDAFNASITQRLQVGSFDERGNKVR